MMARTDVDWMRLALEQARLAEQQDEVPIGAVLIQADELVAASHNQPLGLCRPTAHAEILVLEQAAIKLNNYRLNGTVLYVTVEPCLMCLGAMIHSRIDRLVFGAYEPETGAVCSRFPLLEDPKTGLQLDWFGGVLADEASELMRNFFRRRRASGRVH